jgi:hypothetical protein
MGTLLQRSGVALIFSGTADQVLVDGTSGQVASDAGLQFLTTGYSLDPGTTSPSSLSLSGATIGANTITVDVGKTATISTEVTGTNGMTKTRCMPWNRSQFGLLLRLRRCSHLRHNFATSYRSRKSMRIGSSELSGFTGIILAGGVVGVTVFPEDFG